MSLTWRQKRKDLFIGLISFIILSFLVYKIYPYFNLPPTCVDKKQNGDERGIDCGGSCALICPADTVPLEVKYTRIINTEKDLYDIVALVSNKNSNKNTEDGNINYVFKIYDKSGFVTKTINGSTSIPLGQDFPIILQNVKIDFQDSGNAVTKVNLSISDDKVWTVANPAYANSFFKVQNKEFIKDKNNISQLSVSIKNISRVTFTNVPVKIILFDKNENIIAVNETIIDETKSNQIKDFNLSWRNVLDIEDPKVEVYPIITPLFLKYFKNKIILKYFKNVDWVVLLSILFIMFFGLFTMSTFDTGDNFFIKQIIIISVSITTYVAASNIDYRFLKNSYLIIFLYVFLLILLSLLFIVGYVAKGGNRWLNFGAFSLGPSEPMKLVLVILLAKFFSKRHIGIADNKNIIISLIYLGIPAVLVMLQPDLSTAIILCAIWFGMVLVSGLSRKHIMIFFTIALSFSLIAWNFLLHDYQKNRILTFVNPGQDIRGTGWNAYQSLVAVGSGGILGKGIGYGTQSRLGFLPEHETDFMFASFTEEWGLFGGIIIFILLSLIIFRLSQKSQKANSNFEALFIIGVSIWFIVQSSMNIGMNIGLVPVTGVPLPFMSYGGSHILFESLALGICAGMSSYGRVTHPSRFRNEFLGLE